MQTFSSFMSRARRLAPAVFALALLCACSRSEKIASSAVRPTVTPAPPVARPAGGTRPTPGHVIAVVIDAEPEVGPAPLKVRFSILHHPMVTIEDPSFHWDFGDGSPPSAEETPRHVYERPGRYTARVKVVDSDGAEDEDAVEIQVTPPGP